MINLITYLHANCKNEIYIISKMICQISLYLWVITIILLIETDRWKLNKISCLKLKDRN